MGYPDRRRQMKRDSRECPLGWTDIMKCDLPEVKFGNMERQ